MTRRPANDEDPEGYDDLLGDNDRRAANGGPRQEESDIAARLHHVTLFKNKTLTKGSVKAMTLPDIQALVHRLDVVGDTKDDLPLLKLAKFKNNARSDDNTLTISGIEIDYDGMEVSFDNAVAKTRTMDVRALVYTSPRHEADKPKWRILMPTSTELPPEMRVKLVARVIGFFDVKFDPFSYTLSQSFYYGAVRTNENPDPRTELIDGRMVDQCDELEEFEAAGAKDAKDANANDAKAKAEGSKSEGKKNENGYTQGFWRHLKLLGDPTPPLDGFNGPLCKAVASYVNRHGPDFDREALKDTLRKAIDEAPKGPGRTAKEIEKYLSDAWLDSQIAGAIKKIGESDDDIRKLNLDHAVLPIGGKTKVVTFGEDEKFPGRTTIIQTRTLTDFASLYNKYRHNYEDDKGNLKRVPMGSYWISSPDRRQFDGGQAFMPRRDEEVVGDKLNLWQGFSVTAKKSGAAGCQKFLDFWFEVICSRNEAHFDFHRKREATIFQQRIRTEVAVAMRSDGEGAGKGYFELTMGRRLLSNHAMQLNNPEHVIGKFNPHLESLLRLTADEALFARNHEHRNALFGLITDTELTIEHKFAGIYQAANYLNISITSNAPHFIPVSGTARRFFALVVSEEHLQDHAYFKAIDDQLLNDGGLEALLHHLIHEVDLTGFNVRNVPKTAALLEQASLGRSGVEGLVEQVCSLGMVPCQHGEWAGYTITTMGERDSFHYYLANHRDQELVRMGSYKITRDLVSKWGCESARRRERDSTSGSRTSCIKWPLLAELRAKFVEKFGPQIWLNPEIEEWQAGKGD